MRAKLLGLGIYIALLCVSESDLGLTWLRLFQGSFIGCRKVRQPQTGFGTQGHKVNLWIFLSHHKRSVLGLFYFIKFWFVCCFSLIRFNHRGARVLLECSKKVFECFMRERGARNFCTNVRK